MRELFRFDFKAEDGRVLSSVHVWAGGGILSLHVPTGRFIPLEPSEALELARVLTDAAHIEEWELEGSQQ